MTHHANTYAMKDTAKMVGVGLKALFALLRDKKILNQSNVPYQRYINQGYFKVDTSDWNHPTVGAKLYAKTTVTVAGIKWLEEKVVEQTKPTTEPQQNIEQNYKDALHHLNCLIAYIEEGTPKDCTHTLKHTKQFLEKENALMGNSQ